LQQTYTKATYSLAFLANKTAKLRFSYSNKQVIYLTELITLTARTILTVFVYRQSITAVCRPEANVLSQHITTVERQWPWPVGRIAT